MVNFNKSFIIAIFLGMSIQVNADVWTNADKEIKRVEPVKFTNLPDNIKAEIKRRGCLIPQLHNFFGNKNLHNIIKGSFSFKNSNDYAILCSIDGASHIEIIWGKGSPCNKKIASAKDKNYLQGLGGNKVGFSRTISVSTKKSILEYQKSSSDKLPKKVSHAGIDDGFAMKGSVVHFCEKGKWLTLTGSD